MFCAGFHDINSCRLDAGMTEQVRQFRDIFFEVVKCPRKQEIGYGEIENILKTAGFILLFSKNILYSFEYPVHVSWKYDSDMFSSYYFSNNI